MLSNIYRALIGKPLESDALKNETLPKWKALPIFSSDALSSVGYGPEQIALILAATSLYAYFDWIVIAIVALLTIVAISYSQVIKVHPGGGGSYSIAKDYLGRTPSLVAGAALIADYTLTVAVSVSSGTDALTSAFPNLLPYSLFINLIVLFGILMLINLKGIQEASTFFVWPTYAFIVGMLGLIGFGCYEYVTGQLIPHAQLVTTTPSLSGLTIFFLLHAFANGCSSMTGVEAIANGVSVFKEPKANNAIKTTIYMALLLATMLVGISFLVIRLHLVPVENTTLLSTLTKEVFGDTIIYYFIQIATMLILYLAANTSYNGLPPLLALMSRDGYMPRYLQQRGDRLGFDNSIIFITIAAAILIYIFKGNVDHLISLYALGVFLSFTIAQVGLVVYRLKIHRKGWIWGVVINAFGSIITFTVILIIIVTKFLNGAWIIIVFIPLAVFGFNKIYAHYEDVRKQLVLTPKNYADLQAKPLGANHIIIPLASPTQSVARAVRYAKIIDNQHNCIQAVHIGADKNYIHKVQNLWQELEPDLPLDIIYTPFRQMSIPLLQYIREYAQKIPENDVVTVIIPEFETKAFWQRFLHNQSGILIRLRLLGEPKIIITTVPLRLK